MHAFAGDPSGHCAELFRPYEDYGRGDAIARIDRKNELIPLALLRSPADREHDVCLPASGERGHTEPQRDAISRARFALIMGVRPLAGQPVRLSMPDAMAKLAAFGLSMDYQVFPPPASASATLSTATTGAPWPRRSRRAPHELARPGPAADLSFERGRRAPEPAGA
jgi:hypothetical protein